MWGMKALAQFGTIPKGHPRSRAPAHGALLSSVRPAIGWPCLHQLFGEWSDDVEQAPALESEGLDPSSPPPSVLEDLRRAVGAGLQNVAITPHPPPLQCGLAPLHPSSCHLFSCLTWPEAHLARTLTLSKVSFPSRRGGRAQQLHTDGRQPSSSRETHPAAADAEHVFMSVRGRCSTTEPRRPGQSWAPSVLHPSLRRVLSRGAWREQVPGACPVVRGFRSSERRSWNIAVVQERRSGPTRMRWKGSPEASPWHLLRALLSGSGSPGAAQAARGLGAGSLSHGPRQQPPGGLRTGPGPAAPSPVKAPKSTCRRAPSPKAHVIFKGKIHPGGVSAQPIVRD
ncbi:uncharacterized protein [Myotis yumanensis]|uniref:uncharacterized protein n=1 Tax=Myotis yumanensis TaxID=159337 RepID=UPI0038CF50EB